MDDPFLEMSRSIDELFPKMNSIRRSSADASSAGSSGNTNGNRSSSESFASNNTFASGYHRSETFCVAPPIYEDFEREDESCHVSKQSQSTLLIDQLWDRPPSYDQVMKSNSPLPIHGPSYTSAVSSTANLVNIEDNPMCHEVRGQPVGQCSSPSHSDTSYTDHGDHTTHCVYNDHDDKDTTALLFEENHQP